MAGLDCPVCLKPMREISHQGVLIDTCPECYGVWLDRDELEKIAASLEADDRGEHGPDGRRRQGKLSRLMDFFS